jgi:predicted acyltransferase
VFAACYWLLDARGWRAWARPLVVLGVNAIGLFVFSAIAVRLLLFFKATWTDGQPITMQTWIYRTFFAPLATPVNASLAYAVANLVVLYGVLWAMYRRGVFLKV